MPSTEWYPRRLADLPPWHTHFAAQAVLTGVADGLTAGQVTRITTNADSVVKLINYNVDVDAFAKAYTEYMSLMLRGPLDNPAILAPVPPDPIDILITALPGIEAYTRQVAAILRADPDWNETKSDLYGLSGTPGVYGTPGIASLTALLSGEVLMGISKAGYDVLAVDMRRGGGAWSQIGISMLAQFTDTTDNAVANTPEQRDYRLQGMIANARVGDVSPVLSIVTLP